MQSKKGFTLIECLVALLIIAIILASADRAIGLAIEDVKSSYEREAASWIAGNQYSQYKLDGVYPELGTSKKDVTMAGTDYIVTTNIISTPNVYFRQIQISVSKKVRPDYALFKTINFISQY